MKLIEKVRMATQGGTGYNVFGDLPGRVHDGSFVLFAAHHDAHFHAATDDISCVANDMAIAKAMVMSGYRPAAHGALHDHDRRGVRLHQRLERLVHRRLVRRSPMRIPTGPARSAPSSTSDYFTGIGAAGARRPRTSRRC